MPSDIPPEFWWGALLAALLMGWLVWLAAAIRRRLATWRRSRRGKSAHRAESKALQLLEDQGFEAVDDQARQQWEIMVDDEPVTIDLIADWIVERDGQRFLVEVKTGEHAPSITHAATRRQLLEYHHAFDVDGIYLLDMTHRRLRRVHFPTGHLDH